VRPDGRRPRAVIFDLDNTLIHSSIDFRMMRSKVVRELLLCGVPEDVVSEEITVISNINAGRDYLKGRKGAVPIMEIDARLTDALTECELTAIPEARAVEGASGLIHSLRKEGCKVGILTRGSRKYALAALEKTDLGNGFDVLVCRDDRPLDEAKPNPAALIQIAKDFDLEPEECLFVGDHVIDQQCAFGAGWEFVGVLTGSMSREQWEEADCSQVVPSVAELDALLRARDKKL